MMNTLGTRHHTLLRTFRLCTFRSVGAAALFGSLVLGCSGSYSTQETPDDDTEAPAATNTPAAAAPAASSSTARPAAATPTPTPAATANTATTPAAAPATPPAAAASNTPAAPAASDTTPAAAAADSISFAADVWPILNSDCGPCHVDGNSGGHNAGSNDKALALKDAIRVDTGIISEIQSGGMPLGCGKPPGGGGSCLSTDDFATIQAWVKAGTPP